MLRLLISALFALSLSGCIIGTWPQPEGDEGLVGPPDGGGGVTAGEACDEVDDDGDGVIDEGCPCDEPPDFERVCVGQVENVCATGVQRCVAGAYTECEELESTGVPVRAASLSVTPAVSSLQGDGGETLTVTVTPEPACAGVSVPAVRLSLRSAAPNVEVRVAGRDDGVGADVTAGDGVFSAALPNPLGPSVAPQSLDLEAAVILDRVEVIGRATVELEAAE
ncbi:MAG: choice-of-anchor X domain-containing protein [Myxococcota bacterium]